MCDKKGIMCFDVKCRYYTNWSYINNCVLCVDHPYPMEDIAAMEGVSRQRIDQIEKRAIGKLKKRWGLGLKEALTKYEELF